MVENNPRKNSRLSALLVTGSAITTLLFFMYAFVQKATAEKQRKMAESFANEAGITRQLCEKENRSLLDSIKQLHSTLDSLKNHGQKRK